MTRPRNLAFDLLLADTSVRSARSVFATPVGSAYAVLLPRLRRSPLPNLLLMGAR